MSALGQKRTCAVQQRMSALPPKYSITSSAVASSVGGIVMPSALAVFRLITSLYLVALVGGLSRHIDPQACRLKSDPASVDAPWRIATRLIDAPVPGSWNA